MSQRHNFSLESLEHFAYGWGASLNHPLFIALYGEMGAGKTTFARAFLRGLFNDPGLIVPSPTFTLVQFYPKHLDYNVGHCDFYRLDGRGPYNGDDDFGWSEMCERSILLVEWPEHAPFLPLNRVDIFLSISSHESRAFRYKVLSDSDDEATNTVRDFLQSTFQ